MMPTALLAHAPHAMHTATCVESYGFLPCTTSVWGGLFLALVYGYIVLRGAMLIGDGGEALMDIKLAPGIIGGLVLPIIGALPDAIIIINSGLHMTRSQAEEEIAVGMGTLAGSTVMLLTIVWGGSVIFGRCDLDDDTGLQRDKTLTRPWHDLMGTGVSTDAATPRCAWAMLATAGLYLVVQVPALFYVLPKHSRHPSVSSVIGCVLCFISLAVYCGYQVLSPAAARRRVLAVHKHALRFRAVRSFHFAAQRFGGLLGDDGATVRREVTDRLFDKFKKDESGCLDASDVRSMLIGLEIAKPKWGGGRGGGGGCELAGRALDEHVSLWMREFDRQGEGHISRDAFYEGVQRWVAYKLRRSPLRDEPKFQRKAAKNPAAAAQQLLVHVDDSSAPLLAEIARSASGSVSDAGDPYTEDSDIESSAADAASASGSGRSLAGGAKEAPPPPAWRVAAGAGALLAAGTGVCALFADPLVGTVADLSRASGVPPFFIAFVFMPLASNASELVSSLAFAAGRTSQRISVTFNQVYGAVVLNSTLCLGCFLAIVAAHRLPWTFSSEVAIILVPTLLLGYFGTRRRSWPAAWGAAALGIYPLVLLMQWLLMSVAKLGR